MPTLRHLFATMIAALVLIAPLAAAAQNAPAAKRVIDRARAASGGSGWNLLHGLHETGREGGARYEAWFDPLRYGARTEIETPAGKLTYGYNGQGEWRIPPGGATSGSLDRAALAKARSDAFFGAYAWFYPSRFDVRSSYLGARRSQGRPFEVLRIHPLGGQPRDLWFDRHTGLLGRMIEAGGVRPVTVEYSDYRKVGPVLVPFRSTTYGGDLLRPRERRRETLDFRPTDRGIFSLPRPTPAAP